MTNPNPSPKPVASIHWFNWLGYPTVIGDDDQVVAGVLTAVQWQPNGGIFLITLGGTTLRYAGTDQITIATPAAASQYFFGAGIVPQT